MAVSRWRFEDPVSLESVTLPINPSEGGSPTYSKNFAYQTTAAADGQTIIFEGRRPPQSLEFSGTILDRNHYELFVTWFEKNHQIKIIDDLGRTFWVVFESFAPQRLRSATRPWKHSFSAKATIVNWINP